MSRNAFEQSQTNLAHRLSGIRLDILKVSLSATLSDVDCGKFFYVVFRNEDITLTLPDASTCIGGEIRGMVTEEGTGNHTLTISAQSGQLIDGKGSAGVYENVPLGFPFTATSTGRNWCLVAGVGADGGTGLGPGALTQDLDLGGNIITNCARLNTSQNSFQISFNNASPSTLVLNKPGLGLDSFLVGNFSFKGALSASNPKKKFFKTSAFQAVDPNTSTEVTWPDLLLIGLSSDPISIDETRKRFSFSTLGTYLVSWTVSWQGSSDNHTVETGVNVQVTSGFASSFLIGQQKILGNSDETIQTCTAVVTIDNLASFMSIFVKHSASTPLNVPRVVNTGDITMQLSIHKLV